MNRTAQFSFHFTFLSIISLFLLFTLSCKKDPISSTQLTAAATSTIGSNGGTLETTDFSIVVPAGSFQNDTELSLYILPDVSTFGVSSVSQTFMVEGLPDEFDKSIRLSIKYDGALSDSSYIARGEMAEDFITGDFSEVYQFISVQDSAGFLVGYLPSAIDQGISKNIANFNTNSILQDIFEVVTSYKAVETDHFIIKYPSIYSKGTVEAFGNLFEEIRKTVINDLHFNFNIKAFGGDCLNHRYCWDWPRIIIIKDVNEKISLNYAKYLDYPRGPFINADGILMGTSIGSEAQLLIGKTLLEISMNTYINFDIDRIWLEGAILNWLEEFFGVISGLEPPASFIGNELAPFNGMQKSYSSRFSISHEDGMVAMIKYLIDNNLIENNGLGKIFRDIHEKNIHPVNSILNNVNALIASWWPDFFEKYISGDVYNVSSSVFTNPTNLGGTWDINTDADTLKVFNNTYADLSAHRFIINLNHSIIDTSAKLILNTSGVVGGYGISVLVFGLNSSNNLQHLVTAQASDSYTVIPNLKQYYDSGIRQFLVVVVNSTHNGADYLGNTVIDLNVSVKQQEAQPPEYNKCEIRYKILHNINEVINKPSGETINNYSRYVETIQSYEGSFDGNVFNGSYERNDNSIGLTSNGSIAVGLNSTNELIETFSLVDNRIDVVGSTTYNTSKNLNGQNISLTSDLYEILTFKVEGADMCNYITSSDYTQTENYYVSDTIWRTEDRTTISYECDTDCFLEIKFKTQ